MQTLMRMRSPNLLEYVFGGNPTVADRTNILPEIKTTGRRLSLTFIRLKASKDPSVVIKPMLTNNLGNPDSWDESAVSGTRGTPGCSPR